MIIKEDKRYITIAEYCNYIKVSKQAIYPKLDKGLKPYVIEIEGKKYLDSIVFIEYHRKEKDPTEEVNFIQDSSSQELNESQDYSVQFNQFIQDSSSQELNESQDYSVKFLKFLQDQIAEKDRQIAKLQKQAEDLQQSNREKDTHILEQANKITMLLEQSQELQRNSQFLLATTNKNEQENNEIVEKKGIFKRLFGK